MLRTSRLSATIVIILVFLAPSLLAVTITKSVSDSVAFNDTLTVMIEVHNPSDSAEHFFLVEPVGRNIPVSEDGLIVFNSSGRPPKPPEYVWEMELEPSGRRIVNYTILPVIMGHLYLRPAEAISDDGSVSSSEGHFIDVKCNTNGECEPDLGESFATCHEDCPSGREDGVCDLIIDEVCDPDCEEYGDPDCPEPTLTPTPAPAPTPTPSPSPFSSPVFAPSSSAPPSPSEGPTQTPAPVSPSPVVVPSVEVGEVTTRAAPTVEPEVSEVPRPIPSEQLPVAPSLRADDAGKAVSGGGGIIWYFIRGIIAVVLVVASYRSMMVLLESSKQREDLESRGEEHEQE